MKAKYIGKHREISFGRDMTILEYEYRGRRYTVMEDRTRGNEPLAWQHRSEQALIDRELDTPQQTAGEPFDLDKIFELLDMDLE